MGQMKGLASRQEMDSAFTWRLTDMYASDGDWERDFAALQHMLPEMQPLAEGMGKDARGLLEAFEKVTEATRLAEKLFVYARMRRDEDNADARYQAMSERATQLSVLLDTQCAFLTPGVLAIDENRLRAFLESEALADYRFTIEDIMRSRKHTLDAQRETLLAMAGEMAGAAQNIYAMLDHADLRFPVITGEDGAEVEITSGRFISLMESSDRRVRMDAFEGLYKTYAANENTFAATLSASIKKDAFFSQARSFGSSLQRALFSDNIDTDVYDNLISAVHQRLAPLGRYLDAKRRALGLEAMHLYDIYVPISRSEREIPYDEACRLVKDGLGALGASYGQRLERAFSDGWIDVYENRGKTSGAYCWGVYDTHPYVLLNYQPTLDNVFTLAHELGHAMHSLLANASQPYPNAAYRIFVAEVASTVNEVLLHKHMMSVEKDGNTRLRLLNHFLEQFRTTLYRQVMFAEFEKITHGMAASGEALTADAIKRVYLDLNQKYMGGAVVVDERIAWEWARISHFYNNFYVYQYATGFSAAVAIARDILDEGESAANRYLDMLSMGGSDYPLALLKRCGVDLTTPTPVYKALDVFEQTLDEFEKML